MCAALQNAIVLSVKILPRARHEGVDIVEDGRIRVRVNAAPVDNAANNRLLEILAKEFRTAKSKVEIIAGKHSRNKRVQILDARKKPPWFKH